MSGGASDVGAQVNAKSARKWIRARAFGRLGRSHRNRGCCQWYESVVAGARIDRDSGAWRLGAAKRETNRPANRRV